jgi:hypothetical protein
VLHVARTTILPEIALETHHRVPYRTGGKKTGLSDESALSCQLSCTAAAIWLWEQLSFVVLSSLGFQFVVETSNGSLSILTMEKGLASI